MNQQKPEAKAAAAFLRSVGYRPPAVQINDTNACEPTTRGAMRRTARKIRKYAKVFRES